MWSSKTIKEKADLIEKELNEYEKNFNSFNEKFQDSKNGLIRINDLTPTQLSSGIVTLHEIHESIMDKVNLGYDLIRETKKLTREIDLGGKNN